MQAALKRFLSRQKPMTLMIAGLSIVFGGLIAFNISKTLILNHVFKHYTPPAVSVSAVTVQKTNWHPNLHAVGTFMAVNGVDIHSEAAGNITAIHFQSGETVKKDTLLVDIEDGIDKATLKSNEANLTLQKVNYKRQSQLMSKNATSQSEVDSAKAKMLDAMAKVERTKVDISHKHIKTPFAGRLGIRLVNLGEYLMPGKSKIVTLQSLDPLFIEFHIPEQLLPKVQVGQSILFSVEPDTSKLFTGKITAINARADTQTHNIKIQATVSNCSADVFKNKALKVNCNTEGNEAKNLSDYAFLPGMFAAIEIEQPAIPDALVLPTTAISYSLYGDSVFLINKDNTVKRVFVTTGDEQGNQVVITKGLKAGDTVVSAGEVKLQDGTAVVIHQDIQINNTANTPDLGE